MQTVTKGVNQQAKQAAAEDRGPGLEWLAGLGLAGTAKALAGSGLAGQATIGLGHGGLGWQRGVVSTGFGPLDRLLPAGGVRRGSLVEWLGAAAELAASAGGELPAGGATTLACAVACRLAEGPEGGALLVVDRRGWFHPPAVLPWLGGRAADLYVARPAREDDEIWAIDQALRCPGVAAVLAWPGRVHSTALRRWQLAARATGAVGLFVRPSHTRRTPTWAEARVQVSPAGYSAVPPAAAGRPAVPLSTDLALRRLRLSLVGGPFGGSWCGDDAAEQTAEVILDTRCGRAAAQPEDVGALHERPRRSPGHASPGHTSPGHVHDRHHARGQQSCRAS